MKQKINICLGFVHNFIIDFHNVVNPEISAAVAVHYYEQEPYNKVNGAIAFGDDLIERAARAREIKLNITGREPAGKEGNQGDHEDR